MREILFRGKRTDNGEWEYGDLWCNPYGKRVVCIVSPINDQGTTGGNEVDPETVGQFIGLYDKNSNKIFEGDIIRTKKYGKVIALNLRMIFLTSQYRQRKNRKYIRRIK